MDVHYDEWFEPILNYSQFGIQFDTLMENDFVQISNKDERIWVKIAYINGDVIVGIISSQLVFPQEYDCGDYVIFEKKNIYDIHFQDDVEHLIQHLSQQTIYTYSSNLKEQHS